MGKATRRMPPPRLPDRTELLLERRDKPRAGHPADYASLSRYLPPQKSPPPPSPPPPVLTTVGRRRARRHGGTVRSTALNQSSPAAIIVPRTIMYHGPWPGECGTYEDPRNKYNKGRQRIDKRSTAATSRDSHGTRRDPAPRAHCLKEVSRTQGQRDYTRETCGDGR
ncbi:unnamed protein product [Macrosiphum euphorbiae]|uniref:Uncharacterized protein n=1 Tax=Macrosiphum euphorbiae TaxID=13131 RepID=A0AAV0XKC6_9HEMI|nr:unnamed protein product [Macrosiphum euphorbiae]